MKRSIVSASGAPERLAGGAAMARRPSTPSTACSTCGATRVKPAGSTSVMRPSAGSGFAVRNETVTGADSPATVVASSTLARLSGAGSSAPTSSSATSDTEPMAVTMRTDRLPSSGPGSVPQGSAEQELKRRFITPASSTLTAVPAATSVPCARDRTTVPLSTSGSSRPSMPEWRPVSGA